MKFPFFVSTSWEEFSRQVIRQVGTDWNQGTGKWNLVAMSVGTEGVTSCVNAAGPPGRFHHETTLLTAFSRKPARWGNSTPEKESGRFNWFLTHSNETKTCPFRKRGGAFYVTSSHLVSSFHEVYMNKSRAEMTIKILWFQLLTWEYFLVIWIFLGCWWKTRLLRTSS